MYVGFDIGGTTIKYGVLKETGEIIEQSVLATSSDKQQLLSELAAIVADYQKKYPLAGIGISAPGIIEKDGHMVTAGAIYSLYGTNLKQEMEQRTGLLTAVENDANAAAIAEKWVGNAQHMENYLCIVLGTGIGGGIVLNGDVYRGAHGMAGEFGWMLIDSLPETDDIEAVSYNRKAAVVGGLCMLYSQAKKAVDPDFEVITDARIIIENAETGETLAQQILADFYTDLAVGLINLLACFDPEAILIGGGISANPEFNIRLQAKLTELKTRHKSIHYLQDRIIGPILPAKLKNDAGLIGAVYQVHRKIRQL